MAATRFSIIVRSLLVLIGSVFHTLWSTVWLVIDGWQIFNNIMYSEISTWSLLLIVNTNILPELMKRYSDGSGVFPQDRVSCRSSDDDVFVSRKLSDMFALAGEFT